MRRSLAFAACLAAGCVMGRSADPLPPTTPVRTTVIDYSRPLLEKALRGQGWEPQFLDSSRRGQTAVNRDETWDESSAWVTFTAGRNGAGPALLTPEEATAVLRGLKSDLRTLVQGFGGEVLDSAEVEAFREKTLVLTYRLDAVAGTVRARIGPATGRPEETANRLDLVVREQATR